MSYTISQLRDLLHEKGELIVTLESDQEYDLHIHDTSFDEDRGVVESEGMIDGEYTYVEFRPERAEHVHWHKEL